MKQMKKLDGLTADVAFFPVDGRLEEFADIGAKEFCARTNITARRRWTAEGVFTR